MSRATYFVQACPTCGRRLQIRVVFLGKTLACQHCRGEFEARDQEDEFASPHDSSELLLRVDELLASSVNPQKSPR